MQLHTLQSSGARRKRKRIGRSGKRGSYSGRGVKGQKSRAGRRIRPSEQDLIARIPKQRGFQNKPKSPKPLLVSLDVLQKVSASRGTKGEPLLVDIPLLKEYGIVPKRYNGRVKLLGGGSLQASLAVKGKGVLVSESARMKIEKAGGTVSPA
ncbi:50S ribosomal protein L15 [Candidatus Parcubacteria bacterium]|nr:MAG: 50S ribosomal protein L15 [Candidatus Parcubacteria bacterium]